MMIRKALIMQQLLMHLFLMMMDQLVKKEKEQIFPILYIQLKFGKY